MIEEIKHNDTVLAIIIREGFKADGIAFFTPDDFSQQLAYMHHPVGKVIDPHVHKALLRNVHYTQEVLVLKRGRLRVDFYDNQQAYVASRILGQGDVILLASGGHGFEVLEEIEMIEIKQGPYAAQDDKVRFKAVEADKIHS